eukprot:1188301-Prorocentrum_minimum.AAC.1
MTPGGADVSTGRECDNSRTERSVESSNPGTDSRFKLLRGSRGGQERVRRGSSEGRGALTAGWMRSLALPNSRPNSSSINGAGQCSTVTAQYLAAAGEEGLVLQQLPQDAAQRPHIYGLCVYYCTWSAGQCGTVTAQYLAAAGEEGL